MNDIKFLPITTPMGKVYGEITGSAFVGAMVSAAAGNETVIYNFTSFDPTGTTEYATGTAKETGEKADSRMEIEVLTNSVEGFVGNKYWLTDEAEADGTTLYPLYETSEAVESVGISVKITEE